MCKGLRVGLSVSNFRQADTENERHEHRQKTGSDNCTQHLELLPSAFGSTNTCRRLAAPRFRWGAQLSAKFSKLSSPCNRTLQNRLPAG